MLRCAMENWPLIFYRISNVPAIQICHDEWVGARKIREIVRWLYMFYGWCTSNERCNRGNIERPYLVFDWQIDSTWCCFTLASRVFRLFVAGYTKVAAEHRNKVVHGIDAEINLKNQWIQLNNNKRSVVVIVAAVNVHILRFLPRCVRCFSFTVKQKAFVFTNKFTPTRAV